MRAAALAGRGDDIGRRGRRRRSAHRHVARQCARRISRLRARPAPAEIEQGVAPFRTDFVGETRRMVSGSLFPRDADRALAQKVAYDMSLEPPAIAVASLRSLLSMDFASVLPAVHVPVYAINSDLLPTDAARIRRSLPDFTLDVLDHTGHFLMLEAPARFNPLLLKDIEALSARAGR